VDRCYVNRKVLNIDKAGLKWGNPKYIEVNFISRPRIFLMINNSCTGLNKLNIIISNTSCVYLCHLNSLYIS